MIAASVQSTATLTPGRRYILAIVNGTAGTISPTVGDVFGTVAVLPENSTSAFTVATATTKWITFVAFASTLQINDTSASTYWLCSPITE